MYIAFEIFRIKYTSNFPLFTTDYYLNFSNFLAQKPEIKNYLTAGQPFIGSVLMNGIVHKNISQRNGAAIMSAAITNVCGNFSPTLPATAAAALIFAAAIIPTKTLIPIVIHMLGVHLNRLVT
jgi:hypothetical protein